MKRSHAARPATFEVDAIDERGERVQVPIAGEHPLTVYVDKRELLTLMTLGAAPEELVLGYLRNQRLFREVDEIAELKVDWEVNACAVTTRRLADTGRTIWEPEQATGAPSPLIEKTAHRTVTTGCGQGTVFGGLMDEIDAIEITHPPTPYTEAMVRRMMNEVRYHESIYKKAGAVHGCALCARNGDILRFVEDVGRHNAVDAIAGWMWLNGIQGADHIFYTTGRLTSEMVIKCAQMRIPMLVSRSGVTEYGYRIARQLDLTMIGRCQGKHYLLFSGARHFVREAITGVVLAGGLARRMQTPGQTALDKGLVPLLGKPMAAHAIERLRPQVDSLIINANRHRGQYEALGYPVVPDEVDGFAGPLAGLDAALRHVARSDSMNPGWVLTVPCDSPFLPWELAKRLLDAVTRDGTRVAMASANGQVHPVFALVHASLGPSLRAFLDSGERKIDRWFASVGMSVVPFDDEAAAFRNINTPDELAEAEQDLR